ncbi:arylesterase [Nibricoccus aquaticus]|uniref:Arylesterase n=1 Tax=Nibricoccus aquaticus TaxID=2576891 RepID=A0A290Q415_9BACT|nr:arylesterase [Nibricoccus aquaticus]ATC63244.1 arylesterase [Nibricoccus aquaticus]
MQTTTSFHARILFPLLTAALIIISPFLPAANSANPSTPATPASPPAAVKTILFFGDSLTAGYGLDDPALAFPGRIQEKITAEKLPWRVINAGLSGETTAGGLRRLDWIMRQPVHIFVLELGGNDGLRGLSPEVARTNLQGIIDKVRARNPATRIVIAGMEMPTSMGTDYTTAFRAIYAELARKNDALLIPFLLEGVGGDPKLNLPDGVHPTAEGHIIVAETVWKTLRPLLSPSP